MRNKINSQDSNCVDSFPDNSFSNCRAATAGYASQEHKATDTGLKQVQYNINGVFTTVSGITYDSSSGIFATNNPGIIYTVTQYDRLFKIVEDGFGSPLFFAIVQGLKFDMRVL